MLCWSPQPPRGTKLGHTHGFCGRALGENIADLDVVDPTIPGELTAEKLIVIDVRVVLEDGRRVIVEMQIHVSAELLKSRLVFYTARDFSSQLVRGQDYGLLTPTVTVVWLVEPLFPELRQLHSVFELRERSTHYLFNDDLTLHILQLSEIQEKTPSDATPGEPMVRSWARFLAARSDAERARVATENATMTTALRALEHLSEDPETARLARAREESMFFYHSSLAHAERQGEERGRQDGLSEGKKEGLLEGKKEGLLEGKKEGLLEGKKEGLLEGERKGLLLLLRTKFGEVPEGVQSRVQQGTEAELMRWTQRILSAPSLDDVFGE